MEEIPVYLFTGFMDSGKTTLIKETLVESDFGGEDRTLIISCEDGDVEYDKEKLKVINIQVVNIERQEDFTEDWLNEINMSYHPEQVFLEYNVT